MPDVWINGEFADEERASVSLRDTGLLHGAGVFTTMRADAGKVFRLDRHLARLRTSCEALFIPLQFNDATLTAAANDLLARNELADARMRITVTRGSAVHDPVHGLRLEPAVFITATALEPYPQEYYEKGLTVVLLDEQKLNPYDLQAGHKTLNYLSRLSALREANRRGAGEALWFNVHNYLQSGSISNVFLVKDGKLITPPTQEDLHDESVRRQTAYPRSNVLPGVARGAVIDLAREAGIDVTFRGINVDLLFEAEEVFVTNSIMQVMPVCRLERHAVGDERPGPVTVRLMRAFGELAEA